MADTISSVTNLDIQLLDAERSNATTIKLDNPKTGVTREQVNAAFQPALAGSWFLCRNGNPAVYIGDIVVNQSIKTTLDGVDFFVSPSSLNFNFTEQHLKDTKTVTISGATIQGYNFTNFSSDLIVEGEDVIVCTGSIAANGLSISVTVDNGINEVESGTFDLEIIALGTKTTIPCSITMN